MANYYCTVRTNYFHVKDAEAFEKFLGQVICCESELEFWSADDGHDGVVYAFGSYGSIDGLPDDNDEEGFDNYDRFISGLQEHVADDDAAIIFESGKEKLCYVVGTALIVTKDEIKFIDIREKAIEQAAKMLHNSEWATNCEY